MLAIFTKKSSIYIKLNKLNNKLNFFEFSEFNSFFSFEEGDENMGFDRGKIDSYESKGASQLGNMQAYFGSECLYIFAV